MAIKVNFRCIGCGVCSHVAPNTFGLDDARGVSVVLSQIVTDAAKRAEESCPVNAISIDLPKTAND
ncbi:MAG: ferredoxin [Synergistaceae bacterium]|nr:ferredoxin [Synergistaceae bacterium]